MKINLSKNLILKKNSRPLLVAEISANHCGSKRLFLDHILLAKKSGADLVKIQTYQPEDMVVNKNFKIKKGLWKNKNLWKLYKKAQTPYDWHYDAFRLAKKNNIELFSTPFSTKCLNFLNQFKPNLYKVASFELTDLNLLNEIAKKKKPIIISTGLASISEIKSALKVIRKYHNKIIVLYCVSSYPTQIGEFDFTRITKLKKLLKTNYIGFSDHSKGILASTVSLSHGVCLIERHFKINDKIKSEDAKFSITPVEMKLLKNNIVQFSQLNKSSLISEEKNSHFFRRSIYAIKEIKKGDILSNKNIGCFRPAIGLPANLYLDILGKKSKNKIKKNDLLKKSDF